MTATATRLPLRFFTMDHPASGGRSAVAAAAARTATRMGRVTRLIPEMRLSYLPPLMVYLAAGLSGFTAIVGTFFVKDYLGLSAAFVAALGFWAGLPWALKMPIGHVVDLMWRWKAVLVYLGAGLVAASALIMIGLLAERPRMAEIMAAERWYVLSALLSPVGFVLQDVVADAMTVEAVPRLDDAGRPYGEAQRKAMHTTMQALGRMAVVGGGLLVGLANVYYLRGVGSLGEAEKAAAYLVIYEVALVVPAVSILGVLLAPALRRRHARRRAAAGRSEAATDADDAAYGRPPVNWWVLGGGVAFGVITLAIGLARLPLGQELVFCVMALILAMLVWRLARTLDPASRATLLGTLLVIVVYRSTPGAGPGVTWWMIDELGFDEPFLAKLSLVASTLTLAGLFLFRRFMAECSITRLIALLTVAQTLLAIPTLAMYHGFHEWTAARTNGVVDARFIALVDTAIDSPLSQIALVPMLAWIARTAPDNLKATYFAVIASFSNLSTAAAQLGTKYLNSVFEVTRGVRDASTHAVVVSADYSRLGDLMVWTTVLGCALPMGAILVVRLLRIRHE
jgi:hypothetical protein